jgi:hypothetical protein
MRIARTTLNPRYGQRIGFSAPFTASGIGAYGNYIALDR